MRSHRKGNKPGEDQPGTKEIGLLQGVSGNGMEEYKE